MSTLADFSDEERALLVCLPYKVGVFIGHADDVEGEQDDDREMAALETCIRAIAGLHADKPFTSEVFAQTLAMKDEWAGWAAQSWHVPDEARAAVASLRARASEGTLKNYRAALMEIATTVAQAHGEFGQFDEDEDTSGGIFGGLVSKITQGLARLGEDDADHPMNISASEGGALSQLREALKPQG